MGRTTRLLSAGASIGAVLVMGFAVLVFAQGSGSSRATPTPPKQPTVDQFATSMWQYINRDKARYRSWASSAPATTDVAESPHGRDGRVYFNGVAAKDLKQPANGAILVREELAEDGKTLRRVSMIYRVKGSAPQANDWYWLAFQPNGALARTTAQEGNKPIAGQVASCIACHGKAPGNNFVFSSELPPEAKSDK